MNVKWLVALALLIVTVVVFVKGFFVVRPDQFAIVTEFGEPIRTISEASCVEPKDADPESDACLKVLHRPAAGFYFRIPFIQDVRYLDARVRGWDDDATDTKTIELRTIDFVAFARWRIADPLKFYTAAKTEKKAMGGMDSIVTARIQTAIRGSKLGAIVRDRGRSFEARASLNLVQLIQDYTECRPERNPAIKAIIDKEREGATAGRKAKTEDSDAQRSEIVERIRIAANLKLGTEFGIKIEDLHFKYLNYSRKVHDDMIAAIIQDRKRDIEMYQKIGDTCAGTIEAAREKEKGKILGEKDRTVRQILGDANATAIRTKAQAFNMDPEFFRFIKTLELYQKSLAGGTRLILSSDSPLLALMQDKSLMAKVKRIELPTGTVRQPRALQEDRDYDEKSPAPKALEDKPKTPEVPPKQGKTDDKERKAADGAKAAVKPAKKAPLKVPATKAVTTP